MEGKYYMCVCMQLSAFHASKLSVWLNYVKSPSTKEKLNHGKHVIPEKVSMSVNRLLEYLEGKIKASPTTVSV
jgi:hypothetical protein